MPYAAQVTQKIYDAETETWIDSPEKILISAGSISWAIETDDGDTHVTLSCGTVVRINQSIDQIEAFMNQPREVEVVP